MRRAIGALPRDLTQSITWDQGKEMSNHASFTVRAGIPVYFCDPHSPWQRGSTENTTAICVNTSRSPPTSPSTPQPTYGAFNAASTIALAPSMAT